ncbi:MFS transporter [Streptomyces sp. NPDC053542]|uniref:MFS transporter n=1 Tax=Streptomyces sp. NPDC053542 TaxID=3365710 RepID=UPI0037D13413
MAARIAVPERRGRALAIVYAGMTSAIALGVPLGNAIGNLSSWRWALAFVVLLALITAVGLWFTLPPLPGSAGTGIRDRLTAIRIGRVPTAMLTTTLRVVGTFAVYTYLGSILVTSLMPALPTAPGCCLPSVSAASPESWPGDASSPQAVPTREHPGPRTARVACGCGARRNGRRAPAGFSSLRCSVPRGPRRTPPSSDSCR